MKNIRLLLLFISLQSSLFIAAQNRPATVFLNGDIERIRGIKEINLVYDYEGMKMGEFGNEEKYIEHKRKSYLSKHDTAKAEDFRNYWFSIRKDEYEPKFELLFNKIGKKIGMTGINYSTKNDYTLTIKTVNTDITYMKGITLVYNYITIKAVFKDKNNTEILKYTILDVAGATISECYAKAAKELMNDVVKNLR